MRRISILCALFVFCLQTSIQAKNNVLLRGDCDLNGAVNISDVTALIDYLLSGKWSEGHQPQMQNETFTVNGVLFTMVKVEGGTFMMGATGEQGEDADDNIEKPAHQVILSSYYIGQTEVTQELWHAVMGNNPSYNTENQQLPVDNASWDDCQIFISKLNELTGMNFRLPTEAEWEFAARGGNKSMRYKYSGSNVCDEVSWCRENSLEIGNTTHIVADKKPNELGLFDMSGNVWEWCKDWYGNYLDELQINPAGPVSGEYHVRRGGSWNSVSWNYHRVSYRHYTEISAKDLGLRLAMSCEE